MLRWAHILSTDEGERVFKMLWLTSKKYEKICSKIITSGTGGSKLEQKSYYVICELTLSHYTVTLYHL